MLIQSAPYMLLMGAASHLHHCYHVCLLDSCIQIFTRIISTESNKQQSAGESEDSVKIHYTWR